MVVLLRAHTCWMRPLLRCLPFLVCVAFSIDAFAAPDAAETVRAHALFDRYWKESAERFPEWATWRGDHRFDDRLRDASESGEASDDAWTLGMLNAASKLPREALGSTDRISLDLFIHDRADDVAMQRFVGYRHMTFGSSFGFQILLPELLRAMVVRDPVRAEQALVRLRGYAKRVDEEIDGARRAATLGWIQPRPVLERTLGQIDAQLAPAGEDGPFTEPFKKLDDPALRARLAGAIKQDVLPAQRRLRVFIANELLPKAPAQGGLSRYPGGAEVYAALVRQRTTTDMTPAQVRALGLRELERIGKGFDDVRKALKIEGSVGEIAKRLSEPAYLFDSPDALLDGYRAIGKRIDAELPHLFAELPRAPWGVRAIPAYLGPGAFAYYDSPPPDASEPGWFNANVQAYRQQRRWGMPTLVAHEAVPGHHLQTARALELTDLPEFRRQGWYTAYGEGWALYSETLGNMIGLYDKPEDRFGHLQAQALRAARLVVDTGLHALGWSRQQAVDFMIDRYGGPQDFIESEVDRYLSNPGQALAYMVGQVKIIELRERARAALGQRFDLRRFHNAVLDQGALPLDVLDHQIDEWTATEATRAR